MRFTRRFAFLILGPIMASTSQADLIATEYFNGYGPDEIISDDTNPLNGGTGWAAGWSVGDEVYLPGTNLSNPVTGYDNSANLGGPNDGAMSYAGNLPASGSTTIREFTTTSSTVWFSALISIDETIDRAILWIGSVGLGAGNDFVGVLDGNIQMRYDGINFTTAGSPTTGTHLLLAKAEIDVDGSNDRLTFWFNPDLSGGEAGLGTPTNTDDSADTFGSSIGGVGVLLVNRNSDGSGGFVSDEPDGGELIDAIRVGTTFTDVVMPSMEEPPRIISITKSGEVVTIEFTGVEGVSYSLNESTDLNFTTPDIVDTAVVAGGIGILKATEAIGDSSFYRVESP